VTVRRKQMDVLVITDNSIYFRQTGSLRGDPEQNKSD